MPAQQRRPASRPTRAQRRAGAHTVRAYSVPEARVVPVAPRRSFATEPAPIDHRVEFGFIRKDLIRILLLAGPIIALMIVLSFVF